MSNPVLYQTILGAKAGDFEAMASILRHYSRYIIYYSRRTFFDKYGNSYELVDEDIKQRIEAKLMYQIIYKFDPNRFPPGQTLDE